MVKGMLSIAAKAKESKKWLGRAWKGKAWLGMVFLLSILEKSKESKRFGKVWSGSAGRGKSSLGNVWFFLLKKRKNFSIQTNGGI